MGLGYNDVEFDNVIVDLITNVILYALILIKFFRGFISLLTGNV